MVVGLNGGLGAGFFYTNANCAAQLLGAMDTWTVNIPLVSFQYATDGKINFYSVTGGKSLFVSASRYKVTTVTTSGCECK